MAKPTLPSTLTEGSPIQKLLGTTLEELGGIEFVKTWAEGNPDGFMRLLAAVNPPPQTHPTGPQGPVINLNLPAGLGPGPLDAIPHDDG